MVCRHILAGIESNLECGYVLDIRWANPKVARVRSRFQIPQIDASGRSLPPALTMSSGSLEADEKIHYYRHCLGTLAFTPSNPMAERNPLRLILPLISGTEPLQKRSCSAHSRPPPTPSLGAHIIEEQGFQIILCHYGFYRRH